MKIYQIPQNNINNQKQNQMNQQNPNFTGIGNFALSALNVGATALRFLDVNQAWGATAVDIGCMVAPRTITDFGRGPEAGFETMRREGSGTVNHAAIGLIYGPLAGIILGQAINSKYGINSRKIYADSETVDVLGKIHFDIIKNHGLNADKKLFAQQIADNIEVAQGQGLTQNAKTKFIDALEKAIKTPNKENKAILEHIVLEDFGKESDIILKNGNKKVVAPLKDLVNNIATFSNSLFKEKVINSFKEAKSFEEVSFLKQMKRFGFGRSALGLAIATAIGCCIQPLNIYLTKKKTGSDGFVGGEGRTKDNSKGFKALKAIAATAFSAFAISTIGKPKDFLKNIQYKSIFPTIPQFKLVYGLTIASRFLAARDKDELRESAIKDTVGFSTWLLLGNFVSKGTIKLIDKIRGTKLAGKTRDEVLFNGLKKLGIQTVENGKALSFMELLKKVDVGTRKHLACLSVAQLAGYLFSAAVLGVGIPKLNIYMTKKSEEKRKKQQAVNNEPVNNILKPENIAFLNKQLNFTAANKMLNH